MVVLTGTQGLRGYPMGALRRLNATLGVGAAKPAVEDWDMNPNQPTLRLLVLADALLLRN